MLRFVKFFCFFSTLALTSCSSLYNNNIIVNRDTDYLKARSIPHLRVPPGVSPAAIQAHYPVPEITYPEHAKKVDLTPPELSAKKVKELPEYSYATTMPTKLAPEEELASMDNPKPSTPKPAPVVSQNKNPNYYYDSHTRSTTGGAGKPIKEAVNSVASTASTLPSRVTHATAPTKAPQTKTSFLSKMKSLWPWGNKKPEPQIAQNDSTPEEQKQVQRHYYDRYSQR